MIMESLDEYLETVAGYVFDNDKLVTYKWLSKELEVHVNIAKQILWEFWQRYKEEKDFVCTYLLMGILHDEGIRVEVVNEKDLQTVKEKYSKVLSEHIYSLQKVLPEIQLLGVTENGDIRYSAVKCIENNERSEEEMHTLRWGAISSKIHQSVSQEKAQPISEPIKEKKVVSPEEKQVTKKKNAEKKGFNTLFGKVVNKQKTSPAASSSEKMETDSSDHTKQTSKSTAAETSKKAKQKGGLHSFFQQNKNEVKVTDTSEKENNTSPIKKESPKKKVVSENKNKEKKNVRGKKRNRSKDTNNTAKKRKRITIQSDSSNAESSNEEEVEELPSSPERVSPVRERIVSPPRAKLENGKRKVLKVVDKTFEEDGFLVTKKVHVYESCSEDEPEVVSIEEKKPVASESRPEVKGKKNTKQSSLMHFFKKS